MQEIDKDGKKFDRVSRLTTLPTQRSLTVTLDFANELVQFRPTEHFTLTLAKSLHDDDDDDDVVTGNGQAAASGTAELDESGKRVAKREMWRGGDEGLAADYEYVMYGKVGVKENQDDFVSGQAVDLFDLSTFRFTTLTSPNPETIQRMSIHCFFLGFLGHDCRTRSDRECPLFTGRHTYHLAVC